MKRPYPRSSTHVNWCTSDVGHPCGPVDTHPGPPPSPGFKPLSLTEMRTRARKFVSDWQGEGRENAEAYA